MCSYRVYLTDKENKDKMLRINSKEQVRECINDANKAGYYGFKIIMTLEGTDIIVSRGKLSNKEDEEVEINGLDDEWRIQNGMVINYTKYIKFQKEKAQKEKAQKEKAQDGDER